MTIRTTEILLRTLGLLLILYGGLIIAVPMLLPYAVVWSPNRGSLINPADDPRDEELRALGVDLHLRVPIAEPNISLSCFVMEPSPDKALRGTILLLHGHRDRKLTQLGVGHTLAEAGYRAVLVDHRGHGLSTGDYLSYGVLESHDMAVLLDTLQSRGLAGEHVGVLGFSYGGSVGIQLAAKDERVAAIVSVSTFASLRGVVDDYVHCFLPFVAPLISEERMNNAVRKAGEIGGFNPADANTEAAARKLHIPLLLFHGEDDRRIPIRHGEQISCAVNGECRFVPLPHCGHGDVMAGKSGERILYESVQWFGDNLREEIEVGKSAPPS